MVTKQRTGVRTARSTNRLRARQMRHEPVGTEKLFWPHIRDRRLGGFKFKRQHLIGPYIADYVCLERRVIVELDGTPHDDKAGYDSARDRYLESRGYRVLRFENGEVIENLGFVLETILGACAPSP